MNPALSSIKEAILRKLEEDGSKKPGRPPRIAQDEPKMSERDLTAQDIPASSEADNPQDNSSKVEIILEEKCLQFDSAFDMLCYYDEDVNSGRVTLYPWQMEALDRFSQSSTKELPNEMAICAANGSGKDKYFIAPAAIWLLCCHQRSRFIATTASGGQLASQTEPYIRQFAQIVNSQQGGEFIKIQQRHFTSSATGGEVKLFATDEGGKAEGFHPWQHDSKMALVVNEAKSVLPEIFEALTRCTGYTHHVMVSSPGQPTGDFYKYFTSGIPWTRRVTAYECKHLSQAYIDKVAKRYGEGSCLFRSMICAEFAALDSLVAIHQDWLDACYLTGKFSEKLGASLGRRAGVDLSMGGDETVISCWYGNREIALEAFRLSNAKEIATRIVNTLKRWEVPADNVNIDDGGLGRPIIDIIWDMGYPVNRILNQSSARDTKAFLNRGAEMYFMLGRIMQTGCLQFLQDAIRAKQLCNRKYKQSEALGKFCLQSKAEARAEGQESPDRGDATVLAFANLTIEDFTEVSSSNVINDSRTISSARAGIKMAAEDNHASLMPAARFTEADPYNNPVEAYRRMLTQQADGNSNRRCYGLLSKILC